MKKIIWSILFLLILLGVFTIWIILSQRRLNVSTGQLGQLTRQTQTLPTAPQTVQLDLRTAHLEIRSGTHYQLAMNHVMTHQFKITNHHQQLRITEGHATQHQIEIGKTPVITLTVPQSLQRLTVNQLNGTLILNRLTVDTLAIKHDNGTTTATDLTLIHGGQLTKKNGRTDLRQLTSDGLKVTVKTGQFKLNGTKRANSYTQPGEDPLTITSGTGQVRVTTP